MSEYFDFDRAERDVDEHFIERQEQHTKVSIAIFTGQVIGIAALTTYGAWNAIKVATEDTVARATELSDNVGYGFGGAGLAAIGTLATIAARHRQRPRRE